MENNNEAMETENFYYEDIVDGVNMLLTKETLAIFSEAGISKNEIINKVEENLPPIYDKETLEAYCKRFLQFVLIEQLNSNFAENIDQKAKLNKVAIDGEKPHIEPEVLKRFLEAYESGDYAGVYNVISKASAILTLVARNKAKPHYMDRTQLKVYQKYINDYRKNLLNEFSKISILQPVYDDIDSNEDEFESDFDVDVETDFSETIEEASELAEETIEEISELEEGNLPGFEDEDIAEDTAEEIVDDFEDEEKYELEPNEEYSVEVEENELFEEENNEIDTDAILASIDDLDDEVAESVPEDTLDDFDEELPGFEEDEIVEEVSELEEDSLPGFEDEEVAESAPEDTLDDFDDELPGFEEDETEEDASELEEDSLPGFEDEEVAESAPEDTLDDFDDELPGFEEDEIVEEVSELEEDSLPGFEDEEVAESALEDTLDDFDDELPGFEEDEIEEDASELEEDNLPGFEDEEVAESAPEDTLDDFDDELPGFVDEDVTEDTVEDTETVEKSEENQIYDERRNYDLVFEDNYYEIPNVSMEYLEAHPDYNNSKFVEATGGTNLNDFISTMLYLRDTQKSEIVGIFNNVPLHTKDLYTVDEIESKYDELVEEIDEEDGKLKEKSECISYDEYYNQYIQRDTSRKAVKYQQEHRDIKMVLIPQNNATLEEFVEAALYFIQDDMTGTALNYDDITIIASDYLDKEEIYNALSGTSSDEEESASEQLADNTDMEENEINQEESSMKEKVEETAPASKIMIETSEDEGEVFDKSPEYYKSIAKISKNKTDAYRQRHPECKKVMIVVERDMQTAQDFFEAVRYYNSVNKNIIAQYDGIQLIARKYNSAEEMIEAYKAKKSKKENRKE